MRIDVKVIKYDFHPLSVVSSLSGENELKSRFRGGSELVKSIQSQPVVAFIVGKSVDVIGKGAVESVVFHRCTTLDEEFLAKTDI